MHWWDRLQPVNARLRAHFFSPSYGRGSDWDSVSLAILSMTKLMDTRYSPNPVGYQELGTKELRSTFLVESLFAPEKLALLYSDADRAIVGSAVPVASPIPLTADADLRAAYFCERRELGVLNIGGPGAVEVDGKRFQLAKFDVLYVGRGSQNVSFSSDAAANPACFYLLSYPAHAVYPTTLIPSANANHVHLGTTADANRRDRKS